VTRTETAETASNIAGEFHRTHVLSSDDTITCEIDMSSP
jgi:hypothetical protein